MDGSIYVRMTTKTVYEASILLVLVFYSQHREVITLMASALNEFSKSLVSLSSFSEKSSASHNLCSDTLCPYDNHSISHTQLASLSRKLSKSIYKEGIHQYLVTDVKKIYIYIYINIRLRYTFVNNRML